MCETQSVSGSRDSPVSGVQGAAHRHSREKGVSVVFAVAALEAGQELLLDYGGRDNAEFFYQYGERLSCPYLPPCVRPCWLPVCESLVSLGGVG
jgi:hypothetical protein